MVNKIIGRVKEIITLREAFESKRPEFIAIYGRRRIGKTYLINNFFSNQDCLYFHMVGTQNDRMSAQLEHFTKELSRVFYNDEPIQNAKSWGEAFERLNKAIDLRYRAQQQKVVIFFDELPWIATPKSKFLESLEYVWNRFWGDLPYIKLIICGSSASWIIKKIIHNKGGLYNRVTKTIILRPFLLNETKEYLESLECRYKPHQILEIYMALGGVPFYLKEIKKGSSAMQNINNICFRPDGLLFNEFNDIFKSLYNNAEEYIEIIRVAAKTRCGISRAELESKCKLSKKGGSFTDKLKSLEDAGFILSFLPFNHSHRGIFYKVIDEYSLFYLYWIEQEHKTLLKIEADNNYWQNKYKTPAWHSWSGYAFESVCYKHLSNIRIVLDIPYDSQASTWQYIAKNSVENGAQIDLLFDRKDNVFTLCEIKYTDEPFVITKEYARNLLNKEDVFIKQTKTTKQIFIALISASGLKDNTNSESIINGVVTAEDLFKVVS